MERVHVNSLLLTQFGLSDFACKMASQGQRDRARDNQSLTTTFEGTQYNIGSVLHSHLLERASLRPCSRSIERPSSTVQKSVLGQCCTLSQPVWTCLI